MIKTQTGRRKIYLKHPWNIPRLTVDGDIKNAKADVKTEGPIKIYWNYTPSVRIPSALNRQGKGS